MKFAIRFIQYMGSVQQIIDLSVLAEKAGFESVWYPHDTFMQNTWVVSSAVAAATSTIKIGSVGTNPYTTNPAEIATYIATLDELSRGRVLLGLGLHTQKMVEWTGIDASNCMERTREATCIIRALLRGEVVDFEGAEFQWTDQCYLRFKPFRDSIPIYVCPFGEDYLRLSGEIGDGSLPMITPPESASYMVPPIMDGVRQSKRDKSAFVLSGCAWLSVASDRTAATDTLRKMVSYFGPYLEAPALATVGLVPHDFDDIRALIAAGNYRHAADAVTPEMCRLAIAGTPKDVIEQIERLAEQGVTEVNLGGPIGPDPVEAIRLMGAEVIPYFS